MTSDTQLFAESQVSHLTPHHCQEQILAKEAFSLRNVLCPLSSPIHYSIKQDARSYVD